MSGEAVRSRRKKLNLSQEELSEKAGISRPYLSQIESGTRPGSVSVLEKIAGALGIEVKEFFSTPGLSQPELEETEIELLIAFAKLDEIDRNSVLQHAKALAQVTEMKGILS
ncbi:helix-turn-helix transcriptional regulator [uncultured Sulfitobacter sp.]|uniref:helix-turn-helix domain-containing protein n=1 Tax=uncultured Sulfitobacter sp. TaxID=191468 RepID=UPI002632FD91|nr:helix-turn-helix transcriptional regulator [uncultured Sulfitobacter sp.]